MQQPPSIRFAEAERFDEVVASLAILNDSAPTEMMARLLRAAHRPDPNSVQISWLGRGDGRSDPLSPVKHRIEEATLKSVMKDYGKLSAQTAERTPPFRQLHNKIEK